MRKIIYFFIIMQCSGLIGEELTEKSLLKLMNKEYDMVKLESVVNVPKPLNSLSVYDAITQLDLRIKAKKQMHNVLYRPKITKESKAALIKRVNLLRDSITKLHNYIIRNLSVREQVLCSEVLGDSALNNDKDRSLFYYQAILNGVHTNRIHKKLGHALINTVDSYNSSIGRVKDHDYILSVAFYNSSKKITKAELEASERLAVELTKGTKLFDVTCPKCKYGLKLLLANYTTWKLSIMIKELRQKHSETIEHITKAKVLQEKLDYELHLSRLSNRYQTSSKRILLSRIIKDMKGLKLYRSYLLKEKDSFPVNRIISNAPFGDPETEVKVLNLFFDYFVKDKFSANKAVSDPRVIFLKALTLIKEKKVKEGKTLLSDLLIDTYWSNTNYRAQFKQDVVYNAKALLQQINKRAE